MSPDVEYLELLEKVTHNSDFLTPESKQLFKRIYATFFEKDKLKIFAKDKEIFKRDFLDSDKHYLDLFEDFYNFKDYSFRNYLLQ